MKLDNYRCNTCVLNKNWIEKDEHFTNMLLLVFLPTCNIYIQVCRILSSFLQKIGLNISQLIWRVLLLL